MYYAVKQPTARLNHLTFKSISCGYCYQHWPQVVYKHPSTLTNQPHCQLTSRYLKLPVQGGGVYATTVEKCSGSHAWVLPVWESLEKMSFWWKTLLTHVLGYKDKGTRCVIQNHESVDESFHARTSKIWSVANHPAHTCLSALVGFQTGPTSFPISQTSQLFFLPLQLRRIETAPPRNGRRIRRE